MKVKSILWLALISMSLSLFARPEAGSIKFYEGSFTQLRAEAQASRTPYFIYFYRLDCAPCRKMSKETFNFSPLVDYSAQNYLAYKADVEEFSGTDLAYLYRVKEIPTTLILGPDGDVRERMIGFVKGAELLRKLSSSRKASDQGVSRLSSSQPTQREHYRTAQAQTQPKDRPYFRDVPYDSNPSFEQGGMLSTGEQRVRGDQAAMQETTQSYRPEVKDGNYLDSYRSYMDRRYGASDNFAGNTSGTSDRDSQSGQSSSWNKNKGDQPAWAFGEEDYQEKERKKQQQTRANFGAERGNTHRNDFRNDDPYSYDPASSNYGSSDNYNTSKDSKDYGNDGYGQSRGQDAPGASGVPSFLDPMEAVGYRPEYVWVEDRRVRTSDLPSGTSFYQGEDGEWYAGSKVESYDPPAAYRTTDRAGDSPQMQQKNVHLLVPGFGQYSPQRVVDNTYALEVGSYKTFGELKSAIREVKQYNDSPLWVYSEEVNNKHQYKLVMGAFRSENDAASDAIRKGASWQHIKVINLAQLK